MNTPLSLSLAGLALLDSTSVGTLFIPVWLLLAPGRFNVGKVLVYVVTITVFYFGVGLAVVHGADNLFSVAGEALDARTGLWIQFGVGVGLFLLSFRFDPERREKRGRNDTGKWRDRVGAHSSAPWMVGLALLAGLAEVATMLPYLGAISMLTTSGLHTVEITALLAGYCLVMVVPAVLLLAGRVLLRSAVDPALERMNDWISRRATGATGWVLAISGFLVARDAAARLWVPEAFG
ncbi:GAP family protein [Streptomyces ossamyceticus]|uniref:GAP family protein n=1 Tax=Streptomyces ossamyceticus TaxID=249581 RepID=UPI0006E139D8|nr:GAP family protein [Streptomyces ossamyceticus]